MCVCISLSAYVTLFCLFSPKVSIILFHPDKNVRKLTMNSGTYKRTLKQVSSHTPSLAGAGAGGYSTNSPAANRNNNLMFNANTSGQFNCQTTASDSGTTNAGSPFVAAAAAASVGVSSSNNKQGPHRKPSSSMGGGYQVNQDNPSLAFQSTTSNALNLG